MKYTGRAKNALWRKPNEQPAELPDWAALLRHAGLGGLRSAAVGSTLHALVNLLLLLVRKKVPRLDLIFTKDVLRFGVSLGAFTYLYRILLRTTKYAFFSGSAAGIVAIILSPNTTLSQHLLLRGVQGALSVRGIHPDPIILFSIACAQIMYANSRAPHTLPAEYAKYVAKGTCCPPESMYMDCNGYDATKMASMLSRKGKWEPTPGNKELLSSWREGAIPCAAYHPEHDRCLGVVSTRIWYGAQFMFPVYAFLHLVPTLVMRPKTLVQHPTRVPVGIARSCLFFGLYIVLSNFGICARSRAPGIGYWLPGLASGLSLLVEDPRRRLELALYVLPKAIESAWLSLGLPKTWQGEVIMTAIGSGLVMKTYQENPKHLNGIVRKVLYQLVGNN